MTKKKKQQQKLALTLQIYEEEDTFLIEMCVLPGLWCLQQRQ